VLSELSAGVIALNMKSRITLYNNAAANLLNMKPGKKTPALNTVFPEIITLVEKAKDVSEASVDKNLEIIRKGQKRQFFVRIYAQRNAQGDIESIIVTFDDITELVSAQRTSAWSDVARRIAHEIKNPLTPIHLAAERLNKKYLPQIKNDPENYKKYLDTIIKHVSDIGRMAEEFAKFARIPRPVMKQHDIVALIKDAIFAQECTYKKIKYRFDTTLSSCIINCDSLQISQVLINILKNSAESIEAKAEKYTKNFEGKIIVCLKVIDQFADIVISDNGTGFPENLLDRIFEPYVTTKAKGTGLGLSIVKKMIEDHGGSIKAEPLTTGACIKFTLQLYHEGTNAKS
jgi:two-component system nitrogen regulation sensor histidine kinase NtrY